MNLKRAIGVSMVTYIVSFVLGLGVMISLGVDLGSLDIPQSVLLTGIVLTVLVTAYFTNFYFRDKKIKADARQGFLFGIILIIFGSILDLIMFLLGSLGGQNTVSDMFEYYLNPLFWLAILALLVTSTIVGEIKGRKKKSR